MRSLKPYYAQGCLAVLQKLALSPPTQVDQFVADVEHGQDIPPPADLPPMSGADDGVQELAGMPGDLPPNMGMLG